MTQHSSTPWHVVDKGYTTTVDIHAQPNVSGRTNFSLATVQHGNPDIVRANAAYIVRACNGYEQLLKALRDIAENARAVLADADAEGWAMELADIEREARAALAVAGVA